MCAKTGLSELTLDTLSAYQLRKLDEAIKYAKKHSKFYREHLCGLSEIKSYLDFEHLPFTVPEDILQNPNAFLCVPLDDISRIVTLGTSGTTGKSKRIFFTAEDQELTVDFFHHGMSTFTSSKDRVLICMPGRSPGGVCDLLERSLNRLGAVGRIFGSLEDYHDAARVLLEFCPDVLVGMPAQMYRLAQETAGRFRLKSVLLASDYIPPAFVHTIEHAWACQVFTHYGLTETGLGGAVSCDAHAGYHMRESDLYFEIIDPMTGRALPDGAYGEIVFTTLNRQAMPLIRYRTGDMSQILPAPCICGSAIRRFDHITDRGIAKCINLP